MDQDLQWIMGMAVSMLLFSAGTLIVAFRNLAARLSKCSGELHQRIDDVKEKYVRRDDLEAQIKRVEESIRDVRVEIRESNKQVLEAIRSNQT